MPLIHKILIEGKVLKAILLFAISIYFISCTSKNKKHLSKNAGETADLFASIDYKSVGCFGGETSNLRIINTDREMRAVLTLNKAKYSTLLNSNKIQAFSKFIKELKTLDFNRMSTTRDFYSVKIGNVKIEVQDFGCSWNGFDTLKYALFHQELQQRLNSYAN